MKPTSSLGSRYAAKLLLVLALPGLNAQYLHTTNNGTSTITEYTGHESVVSIPGTLSGLPVTGIGDLAFSNHRLTSISLPDSVTNIGDYAFASCPELARVTMGTNVDHVGYAAFALCPKLYSVVMPNTVTSLGDSAFASCTWLTTVTISSNLTKIPDYAFYSCSSLRGVAIPNGVNTIGAGAFSKCIQFRSIEIPDSVIDIGDTAFRSCTNVATIKIGSGVTNIGAEGFLSYNLLTAIEVDPKNPCYRSVDGVLFDKAHTELIQYPALKPEPFYAIPTTVMRVGDRAFDYCRNLTGVSVPAKVTQIGNRAFYHCSSLKAIMVDELNSFYSSLDGVLFDKNRTTLLRCPPRWVGSRYTIPESVTSIGGDAFYLCQGLTGITIPMSVTSIGDNAFNSCTSLRDVYFGGNAPSLGWSAFGVYSSAMAYYLPGTTGWRLPFANRPKLLWNPQVQTDGSGFGVHTNLFGFGVRGTAGIVFVVEAATNLTDAPWSAVGTNTLNGGASYFSDPQWTNHPARFYRLRSP
jgi:hypothetical protein